MLKMLPNTVKKPVESMFISNCLYTLFSHHSLNNGSYTHFLPTQNNPLLTKLYTFFIEISSVNFSFKHYSQGLYKLKLIKYIRSI